MTREPLTGANPRRARAAMLVAAAALLVASAVPPALLPHAAAASPDVVINEVYGGGGNTGATWQNDFVELHNLGGSSVDLTGWSIQYASRSGTTWLVTPLDGAIAPGGHYLIRQAAGAGGTDPLPTPDATGSTAMSASSGKVALVRAADPLACGATCHAADGVHDFVGYGNANDAEGSPAPELSNTTSASRSTDAEDTDDNAADFAAGPPSPTNAAGETGPGDGDPHPDARIHQIQGAGHISPLRGERVADVIGVVTAVRGDGFWMQDPEPDGDPATSDALFVYTDNRPGVDRGNRVAVSGRVSEFRPGGSGGQDNLTSTEITGPSVRVLAAEAALPAPTVVGRGGRVPPTTVIEDDATGSVETTGAFEPATDGIDFYESLESMLVRLERPVAVGPTNRFGEIPVLAAGGDGAGQRSARDGIVIRPGDFNPERIILDDGLLAGSTPPVNVGDRFDRPATGILGYSFGNFKLLLDAPLTRVSGGLAREVTSPARRGELTVAAMNVENLSGESPAAKFEDLAGIVVDNLRSPGIIAVAEIQDNDGPRDEGVVDARTSWNRLVEAIRAAGGPRYAFAQVDPIDGADGGQPGGNIRVGFLYRTGIGLRLGPRDPGDATTPVRVLGCGPLTRLSHSPGRIDPGNPAFDDSRKPLAAEFWYRGKRVFVVANHWNSKGGDDPLFGRWQPPERASEVQRLGQARAVAAFVGDLMRADPRARVVVAGDLNDFEFSAALRALTDVGLVDLPATLPLAERYTYVFEGNSQVLDHILVSPSLAQRVRGYDVVHVNAEFADQASDHDPQVVRLRP